MIDLPSWYRGGFHDVEAILVDLFDWLLADVPSPGVRVVTWLPDDWYQDPFPVIRVFRTAGAAIEGQPFDNAIVELGCLSRSRADSWELAGFVRHVMAAVSGGFMVPRKDGTATQIKSVEEWVGPEQSAAQFVDDKFIPMVYRVLVREPRRTPDYRQILDQLRTIEES